MEYVGEIYFRNPAGEEMWATGDVAETNEGVFGLSAAEVYRVEGDDMVQTAGSEGYPVLLAVPVHNVSYALIYEKRAP